MPRRLEKKVKNKNRLIVEDSSGNVFKDIGYSDPDAANLIVRAQLMLKLRDIIQNKGWSQRQAAKVLNVGQPRIAEIMSFDTRYFSVDLLLKYLARLGEKVVLVFSEGKNTAA